MLLSRAATLTCLTLALGAVACSDEAPVDNRPTGDGKVDGKADQWNNANNPALLGVALEYNLTKLPTAGRSTHTPWPETYWPTYEDSYNVRWQGGTVAASADKNKLSPAEKYDLAFNNWKPDEAFYKLRPFTPEVCESKAWDKTYYDKLGPAAKWTAQNKGHWKSHDGVDSDADGKTDECDDHDGIETWWGLCHAWTPAAVIEEEPLKAVEYNGVRFEVSDIKALLIALYDPSSAIMLGGRCNEKEAKRDPVTGRIMNDECRDVNAGTWHVVMANLLGVMHRSLAEDRTFDYQVWNQPLIEWKVDDMKEVDEAGAIKALGLPDTTKTYPYNKVDPAHVEDTKVVKWFEVNATSYYITESYPGTSPYSDHIEDQTNSDSYHYILEVNAKGNIIGGEWIGASNQNHPDFLWLPTKSIGSNPSISAANVRMLLDKSRPAPVQIGETLAFAATPGVAIPDNTPAGISSTIDVPNDAKVGTLQLDVNITHTYIGDLVVKIEKDGVSTIVHNAAGGGDHDLKKTFNVTGFEGASTKGTWKLTVFDQAAQDTGTLVSWGLKIGTVAGSGPAPTPTVLKAENTTAVKIPNNKPAGAVSTITVNDAKTIKGLKVSVDVTHTYIGALTIELKNGALKKTLHNKEGGSGTSVVKSYDVSEFNGGTTKGVWTLTVRDTDAEADTGKLNAFKLEFSY